MAYDLPLKTSSEMYTPQYLNQIGFDAKVVAQLDHLRNWAHAASRPPRAVNRGFWTNCKSPFRWRHSRYSKIFATLLARRLTTIPPMMALAEVLETTRLHRVARRTAGRTALGTFPSAAGACHAAETLRAMPHAITC
jgi:hypothetical protein